MVKLKNLELPDVVQSPMANCTDLPFRLIARKYGMSFAFLEMLSSETLVRNNPATEERMRTIPEDWPVAAQIVGCDPAKMGESAAIIEEMGFALVDMNLGCPVPKIVSNGGGSQLLREPDTAGKIFRSVVRSVKKIPVTVKMRLGYTDPSGEEAIRIAKIAQDSGVDAIAVHGRTRVQGYSGTANYEAIRRIKEAVSIPVIGNGDVVDGASAVKLKQVSGCDGVMLGRGALGNPWIYRQVEAALKGEPSLPEPGIEEKKRVLLEHIELQCRHDRDPVGPLRRICCWYFKEIPGVAAFRGAVHSAQTVEQIKEIVRNSFCSDGG